MNFQNRVKRGLLLLKLIVLELILDTKNTLRLFFLKDKNSYLEEKGFFKSFRKHQPMDNNGDFIPFVTYPFLDFIIPKLTKSIDVFEFGSGYSTIFFSKNTKSVTSVEHHKGWFNFLNQKIGSLKNVHIIHKTLEDGYTEVLQNELKGNRFDIIIVDGRNRVKSMKNSVSSLTDQGIIVLDDSLREYYKSGIDHLISLGFKKIDFYGMKPTSYYESCTTIFYRKNNVLDI